MGRLQLADGYSQLAANPKDNYIFIPAGYNGAQKDMHVREDYFDTMSDAEFMAMMQDLAPYQGQGLSVLPIAGVVAGAVPIVKKLADKRRARVAAGTAKPLFKPGGLISRSGTKIKGDQGGSTELVPMDTRGGGVTIGGSIDIGGGAETEPQQTFFQKNKTLLLIGGAAAAAGIIFLVTRKKRR